MIQAGFFETDITPPLGGDRPACELKLKLEAFSDPLKVRVLVLRSEDGTKHALVGIDNIGTGEKFRRKLDELLPDVNIIMSASHTHYAGSLEDEFPGIDRLSEDMRHLITDESVYYDPVYYKYCLGQVVTAVREAEKRLEDAEFSFGTGKAEHIAFNRRIRMKSGRCYTHPGKGNPDNVEYAGPVDESVGVMGVYRRGTDEMLGFVLNFSCHACINLTGITSDYPGTAIETVRSIYGKGIGAVFMQGASGDTTQIDNLSLVRQTGMGKKVAYLVGRTVGAEAAKVLAQAPKGEIHTVKALSGTILLKRNLPDPEFLAQAKETVRNYDPGNENHHIAKAYVLQDLFCKTDPHPVMVLQVLQIGPLLIGNSPGEIFTQFGLDFKKHSGFPFTWYTQLSSYLGGYIPTIDCFDPETGGGYEVETAFFSPDTGNRMLAVLEELSDSMIPEKAPEPEYVSPSRSVW